MTAFNYVTATAPWDTGESALVDVGLFVETGEGEGVPGIRACLEDAWSWVVCKLVCLYWS